MNAQPEALRLADSLEQDYCSCHEGFKIRSRIDPQCESCQTKDWRNEAAAELRRLHAENERLHQINQSHEMKLSVRGYEIQIADLEAQRDGLLKALKEAVEICIWPSTAFSNAFDKARAAITKAEEA